MPDSCIMSDSEKMEIDSVQICPLCDETILPNSEVSSTTDKAAKSLTNRGLRSCNTYRLHSSFCQGGKSCIPENLELFLKIATGKDEPLKIAAIGQAIMQAASPRNLMMPLEVLLAVHLNSRHGKRNIDELHALGFCKSYHEVRNYLRNAARSFNNSELSTSGDCQKIQFIADNVDSDRNTIDAKNTVHWMGQIAAIYPSIGTHPLKIPRKNVTRLDQQE